MPVTTETAPPLPRRAITVKARELRQGDKIYYPTNPVNYQWPQVAKKPVKTPSGWVLVIGSAWSREYHPDAELVIRRKPPAA